MKDFGRARSVARAARSRSSYRHLKPTPATVATLSSKSSTNCPIHPRDSISMPLCTIFCRIPMDPVLVNDYYPKTLSYPKNTHPNMCAKQQRNKKPGSYSAVAGRRALIVSVSVLPTLWSCSDVPSDTVQEVNRNCPHLLCRSHNPRLEAAVCCSSLCGLTSKWFRIFTSVLFKAMSN